MRKSPTVAALRPFAALLQNHHEPLRDEYPVFQINHAVITVGHLREAARIVAVYDAIVTAPVQPKV